MAQKKLKKIANQTLKAIFEMALERSISLRTWQRYKADISSLGIDLSIENLKILGQIRRQTQYMNLPFRPLVECYFEALNQPKKQMLGGEVFSELKQQTKACNTTIIRWFKGCERRNDCYFSQTRIYTKLELIPVFLAAKIYNLKKGPNFDLFNPRTVTVNQKAA